MLIAYDALPNFAILFLNLTVAIDLLQFKKLPCRLEIDQYAQPSTLTIILKAIYIELPATRQMEAINRVFVLFISSFAIFLCPSRRDDQTHSNVPQAQTEQLSL